MVMEGHALQPDRAPPARQELHDLASQSNSSPIVTAGHKCPRSETGSRPCGRGDLLLHLERVNSNFQAAGGGRR